MFDRPQTGERAVLVHVDFQGERDSEVIAEFEDLARSAGAEVLDTLVSQRRTPDPRWFVGSGKAEEIHGAVQAHHADLVIFDHELSPSQERNLERLFEARVLDRTGLILDIFAQRARSFEGKLQVELAQLRHLSTRLVRGWTHLERQKGGIGLRGPGETQLESDRRLLGQRIDQINRRLQRVGSQRAQGRKARRRAELPTVSLVGYTNAGKSSLFNRLTAAAVYAQDQLFATLDPTLRRLELPSRQPVILADTVGFISRLPHELVAAFQSTLQETEEAALLLHVVDAADPRRAQNMDEVEQVLQQIGAAEVPRLEVYNKCDLLEGGSPRLERDADGRAVRVWLSARTGEGTELLLQALGECFAREQVHTTIQLAPAEGRLRGLLFAQGAVLQETCLPEGGWEVEIEMQRLDFERLRKHETAFRRLVGADGQPQHGKVAAQPC